MVDDIKKYGDTGPEQYNCWQYTITKKGEIVICSKDLIKVIDNKNGGEVVETIEAPERKIKVYRECDNDQRSNWEKYGRPILAEVVTPIAAAAVGAAVGLA